MRYAKTLVAVLIASAGLAHAEPAMRFHDVPAGPRALPSDRLPPFGMLDDAGKLPPPPPLPPGVTMPGPGAPPETTAPGPDMRAATAMARAAVLACRATGYRVGAAVLDSAGNPRAMLTADGADGSHVFVAARKALVSLAFAMPSGRVKALVESDPAAMVKVTPAMFVEGGAVPLRRGGRVIGAIGVSGAAGTPIGHADEVCAVVAARLMR